METINVSRTFDTIDLQRLMFGHQMAVDEVFLHNARLDTWREESLRRMVFAIRGYVWAEPPKSISGLKLP